MNLNCILNLRQSIACLIFSMGLYYFVGSVKADQWGDWTYTSDGSNVTITGYTGTNGAIVVPAMISNMPVTIIGEEAFMACDVLTQVTISNSVISIKRSAFYGCFGLTNIFIGNSVAEIGLGAFASCINLTDVNISSSVISIGDNAFAACALLTGIIIPSSVSSIGVGAFAGCASLTNIVIPCSVTNIGAAPFFRCERLTEILVDGLSSNYSSVDGVLFNKCGSSLIQYPMGKSNDYNIPNSVKNIGDRAFAMCANLNVIVIPNSVNCIGERTFYSCSNLTCVTLGDSVSSIGADAFSFCNNLTGLYLKGDAPALGSDFAAYNSTLTIYYYPWTAGWTNDSAPAGMPNNFFGGRPTQINPEYTQWLLNNDFSTNGISSTTNDYDHDGLLNWQEYLAGTSPTNDADKLAISFMGSESNQSQVSWLAKANVSYQVMKSLDLMAAWSNAPSGVGGIQQSLQTAPMDELLQYADPSYAGSPNAFYRVNVVQ